MEGGRKGVRVGEGKGAGEGEGEVAGEETWGEGVQAEGKGERYQPAPINCQGGLMFWEAPIMG